MALLDSERRYDGRVIRVDHDMVQFPDGSTGMLEMIRHPGAAAVVPFLDEMRGRRPSISRWSTSGCGPGCARARWVRSAGAGYNSYPARPRRHSARVRGDRTGGVWSRRRRTTRSRSGT